MSDKKTGVVKLEQAEIILIIVEALTGKARPHDVSAAEALDECDFDDDHRAALKDAADRLVDYFVRCMNAGGVEATNTGHVKGGLQ